MVLHLFMNLNVLQYSCLKGKKKLNWGDTVYKQAIYMKKIILYILSYMILQHVLHNGEKASGSRDIYIDIILCTRCFVFLFINYNLLYIYFVLCRLILKHDWARSFDRSSFNIETVDPIGCSGILQSWTRNDNWPLGAKPLYERRWHRWDS